MHVKYAQFLAMHNICKASRGYQKKWEVNQADKLQRDAYHYILGLLSIREI